MFLAIFVLAVAFTWINGLQDASNAVTTSIVTKSLTSRTARAYAAVLNALGLTFALLLVAFVQSSLLKAVSFPEYVAQSGDALGTVLCTSLVVTIVWCAIAAVKGIPVSGWNSTIASLVGGVIAAGGLKFPPDLLWKAFLPILISPLLGFAVSWALTLGIQRLRYERLLTAPAIRMGQTFSAGLVAAGHGISNGRMPLAFLLIATTGVEQGVISPGPFLTPELLTHSPLTGAPIAVWVVAVIAIALGHGTFLGGHRIIKTLGRSLTDLTPAQGLAAEGTTAALMYIVSMILGAPVSSTMTLTGSIVGSAIAVSPKSVAWNVAAKIVGWWLATPLLCGVIAALLVKTFAGV